MRNKLLSKIKNLIIVISFIMVGSTHALHAQQKADVVIETKFDNIEIKLLPNIAPNHVNNFLKLAASGFYDGTIFHRVIPGFMIQGGDPFTKSLDKEVYGQGNPGYTIPAEFNNQPHIRGAVSMARSKDPDGAGSQFFIVVDNARFLDKQYTLFGRVVSGMEVVDTIVAQKRDKRDNPLERIEVKIRVIANSAVKKSSSSQ